MSQSKFIDNYLNTTGNQKSTSYPKKLNILVAEKQNKINLANGQYCDNIFGVTLPSEKKIAFAKHNRHNSMPMQQQQWPQGRILTTTYKRKKRVESVMDFMNTNKRPVTTFSQMWQDRSRLKSLLTPTKGVDHVDCTPPFV